MNLTRTRKIIGALNRKWANQKKFRACIQALKQERRGYIQKNRNSYKVWTGLLCNLHLKGEVHYYRYLFDRFLVREGGGCILLQCIHSILYWNTGESVQLFKERSKTYYCF